MWSLVYVVSHLLKVKGLVMKNRDKIFDFILTRLNQRRSILKWMNHFFLNWDCTEKKKKRNSICINCITLAYNLYKYGKTKTG